MTKKISGPEDGKTFFQKASERWRALDNNERAEYSTKAMKIREDPLPHCDRDSVIRQKLRIIAESVLKFP